MRKVSSPIVAVIMAGGKGTRLGQLGALQPKCLLPIGGNATLLTRLIGQLQNAGIADAAICCSPENYPQVDSFLKETRTLRGGIPHSVQAIPCSNTRHGPLPALAEMVSHISAKWLLLCMADIFFLQRPYDNLVARADNQQDIDGFVITGIDQMPVDGRGTGVVACDGASVHAISYHPTTPDLQPAGDIRRWSGSFLFRTSLTADLQEHASEYHGASYETWLQGLLERGARCAWIDAGPFVNVNSTREYEFLVHSSTDSHGR